MKNLLIIGLLLLILGISCKKENDSGPYTEYTVSMGANSVSDVYYSLANGESNSINRADWDIAFSAPTQSATVLINEGAGVELYCAGDTNQWDAIDENTTASLAQRFNDKSGWSVGAFNHYPSGIFNFGWGTYNPTDHNVYGDSIYVIKLTNGEYKKFWYKMRFGGTATHILKWANLDGSEPVDTQVEAASFVGQKNFAYYSIVNQEIIDAEPALDQWDLLFTRYVIQIPAGPGVIMNYTLMGVLSNIGVLTAKVTGVPPAAAIETDATGGYSDHADVIGYDWMSYDPNTHEVTLADSVSYFIHSVDGKIYQLYFTNYGGNTAGTISFKLKTVE